MTSRSALEGAGFAIVEERQPSFLLDGSVLVTGEVDRTTPFETGFLGHQAHLHDHWEPDPLILDDQAIVMRLAGRGLVVLTGCGHAGIINVVRQAQRLTGETSVAAVIGGFHLSGPMFEPIIDPTVAAFDDLQPELLDAGPLHRLEGGAPPRPSFPRRVRPERGRDDDLALRAPRRPGGGTRADDRSTARPGPRSGVPDATDQSSSRKQRATGQRDRESWHAPAFGKDA